MQNSKKMVRTLMLTMVFMMMFSSVSMAASIVRTVVSDVESLDITKEQAEDVFVIRDNTIIGIAPAMEGLKDSVIIPDSIDGVPVDVNINRLAEYNVLIELTQFRGKMDPMSRDAKDSYDKYINTLHMMWIACLIATIAIFVIGVNMRNMTVAFLFPVTPWLICLILDKYIQSIM